MKVVVFSETKRIAYRLINCHSSVLYGGRQLLHHPISGLDEVICIEDYRGMPSRTSVTTSRRYNLVQEES